MLRYFRQIRKKLIEQDNVRKYLLYAIGEILLVVIGILIALQVNNWNQDRLNKEYEQKMLLELVEDLKLDTTYLNVQFSRIKRFEEVIDLVLNDPQVLKINAVSLFGGVYFTPNTKTIETIKSGNVQIPFNDNLRKQINSHYHSTRFYLNLISMEDKNFREFRSIPLQRSLFKIEEDPNSENFDTFITPINYEATLDSKDFNDYVLLRKSRINRWKWAYQQIMESTLKSIDSINSYLEANN